MRLMWGLLWPSLLGQECLLRGGDLSRCAMNISRIPRDERHSLPCVVKDYRAPREHLRAHNANAVRAQVQRSRAREQAPRTLDPRATQREAGQGAAARLHAGHGTAADALREESGSNQMPLCRCGLDAVADTRQRACRRKGYEACGLNVA